MSLPDRICLTEQQLGEITNDLRLYLSKFLLVEHLFTGLGLKPSTNAELPWGSVCRSELVGSLEWLYYGELPIDGHGKYRREQPAMDIGFYPPGSGSAGLCLAFNAEKGWKAWIDQRDSSGDVSPLILEIAEHFKIPGLDQSAEPLEVLVSFAEDLMDAERLGIAATKPEMFAWLEEKDVLIILKAIAKPFISKI